MGMHRKDDLTNSAWMWQSSSIDAVKDSMSLVCALFDWLNLIPSSILHLPRYRFRLCPAWSYFQHLPKVLHMQYFMVSTERNLSCGGYRTMRAGRSSFPSYHTSTK